MTAIKMGRKQKTAYKFGKKIAALRSQLEDAKKENSSLATQVKIVKRNRNEMFDETVMLKAKLAKAEGDEATAKRDELLKERK